MNILKLTDSEINLLINALEIAANQFEIDAKNNSVLNEQFTKQARDARTLADKVERAQQA